MNILSLDIGGTAIKSSLVKNGLLEDIKERASEGALGGQYVLKNLFALIDSYQDYDAVGISTTGFVNSQTGTIAYANENIPNYDGICFKDIIKERYQKPCYLENDVNAAALGEAYYGAGKELQDFLCITYGTGIGGAIIADRKLYKGPGGLAGEVGHMIVHANGNLCNCGNRGCYENYASATALVRNAMTFDSSLTNGYKIFTEVIAGNQNVISIVDQWIEEILLGLISLNYIFNPSHIILGGGIMKQEYILDKINKKIPALMMDGFREVNIVPAKLGNHAGIYGMSAIITSCEQTN